MAVAAPPPSGSDPQGGGRQQLQLLGPLREVRADIQDLQRSLRVIGGGAADLKASDFATHREAAAIREAADRVNSRLTGMKALLDGSPVLGALCGDEVEQIGLLWGRISRTWAAGTLAKADATGALPDIASLIYLVGLITIPPRVNEHLRSYRVGQTLDFNEQFKDELESVDQQQSLLQYLYSHPLYVEGLVDVPTGLIYRATPSRARRVGSYVLILGTMIAMTLIFGLLSGFQQSIPHLPSATPASLVAAAIVALVGAVAHLGIGAIKQVQQAQAGGATFVALGNWLLWVHVREVYLCVSVAGVGIAALGVIITTGRYDPLTMLLAGYSWDSLQEIFLPKFTSAVATRTAALTN